MQRQEDKTIYRDGSPVNRIQQKMNAANVRYTEFHDGGHWVWDPTFRDRQFLNWLLKQNRQKKPADNVFMR